MDQPVHRSLVEKSGRRRLALRLPAFLLVALLLALAASRGQAPAGPVSVALLGDVMLGRGVAAAHAGEGWETALEAIGEPLRQADLAAANLESPLTAAPLLRPAGEGKGYDLRAPQEAVRVLTSAGINLVSVANNHSLDAGAQGLEDTMQALDEAGITPLGPAPAPVFRKVRGETLAFLAFEDVTAPLYEATAVSAIRRARAAGAAVIVSVHWGREYQSGQSPRQEKLAQAFADAGAALIWGHHPHVLQPVRWVQGEGQPRPTLVAYSLGNALFDQVAPASARKSELLVVKIERGWVGEVERMPLQIDPFQGIVTFP